MSLEDRVAGIDRWAATRLKAPVASALDWAHLTATQLNFMGLGGCFLAGVLAAEDLFVASGCVFFLSSALDLFDGTLARRQGTATSFSLGGWLDAYLGSVGEAALYIGVAFATSDERLLRLLLVALLTTVLTSHAKAVAGEYGLTPDWREAGGVGRGLRVLFAALGLIAVGVAGDHSGIAAAVAISALIGFNLAVLWYRIRKIVASAKARDEQQNDARGA